MKNMTRRPYKPGTSLNLEFMLTEDGSPFQDMQECSSTILKTLDVTMSTVVDVIIKTKSGSDFRAVLKLYDRRFGKDLRKVRGGYLPHTSTTENAFMSFIQQGHMEPFLLEMEEERRNDGPPSASWYFDGTSLGIAKIEAFFWQYCNNLFDCETKAYKGLSDLQGKCVPKMYGHVRVVQDPCSVLEGRDPPTIPYLEVKGVLLELIESWEQRKTSGQRVKYVDLGLGMDKDEDKAPYEDEDEGEDKSHEQVYWERIRQNENPVAIGCLMALKLERKRGLKVKFKYPDYAKIIGDLKTA